MDLEAHTMTGTSSPRWAKMLAFACFAVACGLLVGSLSKSNKAPVAGSPTAAGSFLPIA